MKLILDCVADGAVIIGFLFSLLVSFRWLPKWVGAMNRVVEAEPKLTRLAQFEPILTEIAKEMKPNGGDSIKDHVDKLAQLTPKILAETNKQTPIMERVEQAVGAK